MTKLDLRQILKETRKSAYNGHPIKKLEQWKYDLKELDDREDKRSLQDAIMILELVIELKKSKSKDPLNKFKQSFLFIMFIFLLVGVSASINYNVGGSYRLIVGPNVSTFIGEVLFIDDLNGVSRSFEINLNNGSNAVAAFTAINNINESIRFGITGNNYSLGTEALPNQPFIFSSSNISMLFVVGGNDGFLWRNNILGTEKFENSTNILMDLDNDGNLNITNNSFTGGNATVGDFLILDSVIDISPSQSTLLRRDDNTGLVGTVGGSLVVTNILNEPIPTSGVNYVWNLGSDNNVTVDLHSSLDPDDPLMAISHYFNDIKGHIWRLNPNSNSSFFQWESGADNNLFTINGTGLINLNDSIILSSNGSITFPELTSCDTIQSDVGGLLSCGTGGGVNVSSLSLLSVYKNGTQTTTASFSDLTDWTEDITDTPYSFNTTSGVITFDESGRYLVSVDAKINGATGRSTLSLRVAEDFGSGFIFDTRKVWINYVTRNAANNEGGVGGIYIKDYSVGDQIKLQVKAADTQNDIATNDSRIYIIKMQGSKGDPGTNGINGLNGTDGINGSVGPTGAGANIIVQKDNVTIGAVTDTLNFEGAGVTSAIDAGNNKTTITIGGGVFGSEFEKFESLSQSNTTSVFTNKLSATSASKPIGTYRIGFTVDITNSNGADIWQLRFSVNGSVIHQHISGSKEYENKPDGPEDWEVYSTFLYFTVSSPQTIDLLIEFGTVDQIARASNAAIEIWRVA